MPENKTNTTQKKSETLTSSKSTDGEKSKKETGPASINEGNPKAVDKKEIENKTTQKDDRKSHVRGENQKPVTQAYRNNWNNIFKNNAKK